MGDTTPTPYAVVSCHVEWPLDDDTWTRFSQLQERRPGGFAIAALLRPADVATGEDESLWAVRAHQAAARGTLGHHTHWTAPDHARPTSGDGTGARVLAEGERLRALGLAPTTFCGGGWYTDTEVAEACAELGYVDCTPRMSRPRYLAPGESWAALEAPARVRLPSGRTLSAVPTTHSLGDLVRVLGRRPLPGMIHVYFHDTDLRDRRRRVLLSGVLVALARRARPTDLDTAAGELVATATEVDWPSLVRNAE